MFIITAYKEDMDLTELKWLAQYHMIIKNQIQDISLGTLIQKPEFFSTAQNPTVKQLVI